MTKHPINTPSLKKKRAEARRKGGFKNLSP
jgi:hypothetical protein